MESKKYFSWSEASVPLRVRRSSRCTSSTRTRVQPTLRSTPATAAVMACWLSRLLTGRPKNAASSMASVLGVAAGGTMM
jgi:hypothetical protein